VFSFLRQRSCFRDGEVDFYGRNWDIHGFLRRRVSFAKSMKEALRGILPTIGDQETPKKCVRGVDDAPGLTINDPESRQALK